jgi:ABC-type branched-subunit amino acid transport system substrate-binding protein
MNLSRHVGRSSYPVVAGVVAGILIAGLTFRLSTQAPSTTAAASGAVGAPLSAPTGGPLVPGTSSATAAPRTGPSLVPAGTAGATGGATGGTTGTTGTSGDGSTGVQLKATDVGVTATTIKVGIALLNVGAAASFVAIPGQDPAQQRKQWQAFIDEINKSGGIQGRKIQPYYQTVDVTNSASGQAACTTFTETYHVFAVFTGNTGVTAECVALQHRTLDIADFAWASPATARAAGGLLVSRGPTGLRAFADWARALEHLGKLKGRTLGLIVDQEAEILAKQGLVPTLQSMGYKLAYTAVVSKDPSTGPGASSTHVPQMRAAGVNTVLDATSFANMAAFVNAADKQQWKPQYIVNSYDGNDVGLFYSGMPESWNGALAISYFGFFPVKGRAEQPVVRQCRDRYNKQTGSNMGVTDVNVTQLELACTDLNLLVTAGRMAGPDLTRERFAAAVQAAGTSFGFAGLEGSFGPGKFDWADQVRPMVWGPNDGSSTGFSGPCDGNNSRCWNDAGPAFRPSA